MGDFNCNYLVNKDHTNFKEQLSLNGLVQLIKEATRTTERSQNLIDLLLSNKPEHLCDIEVISLAISDHDVIRCRRKIWNYKHKPDKRHSLLRKFRKLRSESDHKNFKCQRNTKSTSNTSWMIVPINFLKSLKSIFPVKGKEKLIKSFLPKD